LELFDNRFSKNQFSAICEIGRIRRKCPFSDRFHRPPQAAQQQQNEYHSRHRLSTLEKQKIALLRASAKFMPWMDRYVITAGLK